MTAKELFKKFSIENEADLPFSLNYRWWNEVVVENWDVVVLANGTQIKAVWPFFERNKGPWKFIANPYFTPYSGPFIVYPEGQKPDTKISYENKIHRELIVQLPKFSEMSMNFHLGFMNSLVFHWDGFKDFKRFTYLLDLEQNLEDLFGNFRENTKRQIRKAEKLLSIKEKLDPNLLESLLKETYSTQKNEYPAIPSNYFHRIANYIKKYNCGKMFVAEDSKENIHATALIIWDHSAAYYLIGGAASTHKNSGAMSLLMWNAIQFCKKEKLNVFNFEGSSVEQIEKFIRGFGGNLTTFSNISAQKSKTLEIAKGLKG